MTGRLGPVSEDDAPGPARGWSSYEPVDADRADEWQAPGHGSLIRLMGDHGVAMPLWEDGLLLADADEGVRLLGLSRELASALQDWGTRWDGHPDPGRRDADAEVLVERLRSELGDRYDFRYVP